MKPLQISKDNTHLIKDGEYFFWLADTCWSAFTNISDEEWIQYLDLRAGQGFNVLQINTLPQWDRCGSFRRLLPFPSEDGARFDFSTILPEYFEHARWMCREAVERGFTLMLVVMWCNYVPQTWASDICADNVIPDVYVQPIVKKICESFNEFCPVYSISGDTGFDSKESIERYRLVTDLVNKYAPDALKTYHIKGRYDGLPQEFAEKADIYMYQSGHNVNYQNMANTLAETFAARVPRHPVINGEPCYEQMGYSHKAYGRFRRCDIRAALWNSLLSGANAGITYGAHGVWNWFKPNMPMNPIGGEGFLQAMPVDQALRFPGARDFAFARKLFEKYGFSSLIPCQEILESYQEHIRAARTEKEILIYIRYNAPLRLREISGDYKATAIDLNTYESMSLKLQQENGVFTLEMHSFYEDVLVLLEKV